MPAAPGVMAMSQNLPEVDYYNAAHEFVDVFKTNQTWLTQTSGSNAWDSGMEQYLPVDANGWPTTVPFTTPSNGMQTVHTQTMALLVSGTYRLRFSGTGNFRFMYTGSSSMATVSFTPASISQLPVDTDGKSYYDTPYVFLTQPDPSGLNRYNTGKIMLYIDASSGANYLRDFECITPGYAETNYRANPYNPAFEATLVGCRTIRTMTMGRTSGNPLQHWSQRTTPSTCTQTGSCGASMEYMVKLCNDLGANLWFAIPHQADSTYVTNAASVLLNGSKVDGTPFAPGVDPPSALAWPGLNPALKAYIEYSNETWNGVFSETYYCIASGTALRAQGLPFSSNNNIAGDQFTAYQSANVWQGFYQVWGTQAPTRLVRVLASMCGSPTVSANRLGAFTIPGLITNGQYPDALAIAPYFGGNVGDQIVSSGSLDTINTADILQSASANMVTQVIPFVAAHKALADSYGVFLNCYEGGQSLVGTGSNSNNTTLTAKLEAANRDPGMGQIYAAFIPMLASAGVVEFCNYSQITGYGQYGSWGALEWLGQESSQVYPAYKYQAIQSWMQANPLPCRAPLIVVNYPASMIDSTGVSSLAATLSATNSYDYFGSVNSLQWNLSGSNFNTSAITPVLPVGTTPVSLTASNNLGSSSTATFNVLVRPYGSDTVLMQSLFDGTSPGMNNPWTQTISLNPCVTESGWSYVLKTGNAGVRSGGTTNNVFALVLDQTNGTPVTLDQAVATNQYASCTITPVAGSVLDLRGAEVDFTIECISMNSVTNCALMTGIGGFNSSSAVLISGSFSTGSASSPADNPIQVFLPGTSDFAGVTGPVEFRIYFFGNRYAQKEIRLTAFELRGAVNTPQTSSMWTSAKGLGGADASQTATPAKDGISNLVKYALGLDPSRACRNLFSQADPATPGLPSIHSDGTSLYFDFQKDMYKHDITYTVEASTDLLTWTTDGVGVQVLSATGTLQNVQASILKNGKPKAFIRLRVTVP